ncbi:RNA-binding protein 12B-like [Leptodactylus fuscus]|uniref:RNA-binding protein 12B-like n=1 Tax=Leptodactylus fuscus TaxID=238119 RepID=UPI003F4F07FB
MSCIVRLQGLPAVATSHDIRQFFSGLNIPRGGVYITGGKYGEAYIVFATYQEAQYAVSLNGYLLRDSCVHLTHSNEEEMKRAMEVYQIGLNPSISSSYNLDVSLSGPSKLDVSPKDPEKKEFSYLCIRELSWRARRKDIEKFFKGLDVVGILHVQTCMSEYNSGKAIVKFGKKTDASEAVKLHLQYLCFSQVILRISDEDEWKYYGGDAAAKKQRSPSRSRSRERYRSRSRSPVRRRRSRSPVRRRRSRSPVRRRRSRSPARRRSRSGSPSRKYYVHLINLSHRAEKKDIKTFFHDSTMEDSQITFLVDKEGKRTREGFVTFNHEKDYMRARNLDRAPFKGHTISILPISKRGMQELIDRMKVRVCKDMTVSPTRSSQERRYLYLRNFVSEVTKTDVQKFFTGLTVKEDDIHLLCDGKGVGLGEVLVTFSDEEDASKAEKSNSKTHLGINILLSRVTEDQVKALKQNNQVNDAMVSEEDNRPDSTSDSVPSMAPASVEIPSVQTNEDSLAPDSSQIDIGSHSEGPVTVNEDHSEGLVTVNEDHSEGPVTVNEESEVTSESNLQQSAPSDQSNTTKQSPGNVGGFDEGDGTFLYIRNLPSSVTAVEILNFFHNYKVSSMNLKNIERGVAIVRMQNPAEVASAINALNNQELGFRQVVLSAE